MRIRLVATLATALAFSGASAEPLNFSPKVFGDYFNETAAHLKLRARLALRTCPTGGHTCTFQTSTGLYCFAFSKTGRGIESVQCILASKGDDGFMDMMELFQILPSMFQPPASQDERFVAMMTVMKRFNESPEHHAQTFLHDVAYTLELKRGLGTFFTAKAAESE